MPYHTIPYHFIQFSSVQYPEIMDTMLFRCFVLTLLGVIVELLSSIITFKVSLFKFSTLTM